MQIPGLIWDACTLLNLLATGRVAEIFAALNCPHYIVNDVWQSEALYLRPIKDRKLDPEGHLEKVDVASYIQSGLFVDVEMSDVEQATFVNFAANVDDGEAKTLAVAVHRGFWITTDDRGPLKLAVALNPPVPTLKTLQWLQHWATAAKPDQTVLEDVLRNIRLRARYAPSRRREDPLLCDWWENYYPDEE